jgi:hypothetical protein
MKITSNELNPALKSISEMSDKLVRSFPNLKSIGKGIPSINDVNLSRVAALATDTNYSYANARELSHSLSDPSITAGEYKKYFEVLESNIEEIIKFYSDKLSSYQLSEELTLVIRITVHYHILSVIDLSSSHYIGSPPEDSNYLFVANVPVKDSQGEYHSIQIKSFFQAGYFLDGDKFFHRNKPEEFADFSNSYELVGEIEDYLPKRVINLLEQRGRLVNAISLNESDITLLNKSIRITQPHISSEDRLSINNAPIGCLYDLEVSVIQAGKPITINTETSEDLLEITNNNELLVNSNIRIKLSDDQAYFLNWFMMRYNRSEYVHIKDIYSDLCDESHDFSSKSDKAITALCKRISDTVKAGGVKNLVTFKKNKFCIHEKHDK